MLEEEFRIYFERLRHDRREQIQLETTAQFLAVNEPFLSFNDRVVITGEAYLADDSLIVHLDMTAQAVIPCTICNKPIQMEVKIPNFYHVEPLENIKSGFFDFKEVVREAILLEAPTFAECNHGSCPKRQEMAKYLADKRKKDDSEKGNHPFANL